VPIAPTGHRRELAAGAHDALLDPVRVDAELRGGVVERTPCKGHQQQGTTLVQRDAVEVVEQPLELLSYARVLLGILAFVHRRVEGLRIIGKARRPALLAQVIDGDMHHDPMEKRRQACFSTEPRQRAVQLEKHFLDHILAIRPRADELCHIREHIPVVT
jgi:hypothetical protein